MWTANAATVAPSADTEDGRLHLTAANLSAMLHRSLEGPVTARVLSAIFADARCFGVHPPLPAGEHFSDEGAANHSRLCTERGALHLFGWGRRAWGDAERPRRYPARQTFEASASVARLNALSNERVLLWQQSPRGIDVGAFHSDVLAVGNDRLFIVHEHAFVDLERLRNELESRLGPELVILVATEAELSAGQAVAAYPFNSQIVTLPDGAMAVIAPLESRETDAARLFLERVAAESGLVKAVHYVDVNASMNNGGGPACLRLRVAMTDEERARISARVFFDEVLDDELVSWVERHYRDRLADSDLADPSLLDETRRALDELCSVLRLGSIYDFQQP
jgi:succinylarginine dihydrolase